jgi:hypothetical protein
VPVDLAMAAACGGFARFAALRAARASRVIDADCRLLTARRRRAACDRQDGDLERQLRRFRAAGMAHLRRAQAADSRTPLLAPKPAG